MKYSKRFNKDFNWYLKVRNHFTFSGDILRKDGHPLDIEFSLSGVDGKQAYHTYDSTGKLLPTKHPNLLRVLLKTKASVNFQVKQWAIDRAKGELSKVEFMSDVSIFCKKPWSWYVNENKSDERWFLEQSIEFDLGLPEWVVNAVESQKSKYY